MVLCIYCTQNRLSGDGLETIVLKHALLLFNRSKGHGSGCTTALRGMQYNDNENHKTCTCVYSTFPVPVAIFMFLLLAFPVLQIHGTKECYKGGSQAAALLKYVIIRYIVQKYMYWWQHCQRDIHISYSMASRLCLQNVYINELIWWPHDNTNSIIKNWCSLNWLEVTF